MKQSLKELQDNAKSSVEAIAMIAEMRDPHTASHQWRVVKLAYAIAEEMGLSEEQTDAIYLAALVHDIRKIGIPAESLMKPCQITDLDIFI